jgi:hypothetical protein
VTIMTRDGVRISYDDFGGTGPLAVNRVLVDFLAPRTRGSFPGVP